MIKTITKKHIQAFNDGREDSFQEVKEYINRNGTFTKRGEVLNKISAREWDKERQELKDKGKELIQVYQVERIDQSLVEPIKTLSTHKTWLDANRKKILLQQIKPFSKNHPFTYRIVTNSNKLLLT